MKKYLLLSLLLPNLVLADAIFKVVDANGNITYTNIPTKGGKRIYLEDATVGADAPAKPKSTATASPASFPKVDTDTQKKRDAMRYQVLNQELADEQKMLDDSRKALMDPATKKLPIDKQSRIQESVTIHQKNIEALQKELAGVKEY
ncbi:DUF4124 domain-containing protein [Leeia oryzae]|uniref:DUF4124 domain-containing protein n=1 Tax=Leeia oryzae TaxID=356662 RepID=UPI0003633DFC|nr:DUF4124 domain-containing protein [Leeia oryzae]